MEYLIHECKITPENIIVGDGGFSNVSRTIKKVGAETLETDYGVKVMDLDQEKHITIKPKKPLALKSFETAVIAEEVDVIISIPSLKTHIWTVTTLSMKNLTGLLKHKSIIHSKIHKKVADLTHHYRSKMKLSIIDGYIGSDMSETGGSPVKMDVLLISEDPVALDTVGSYIIGYTPIQCKYLTYGTKMGLGESDLSHIEVVGPSLETIKTKFRR